MQCPPHALLAMLLFLILSSPAHASGAEAGPLEGPPKWEALIQEIEVEGSKQVAPARQCTWSYAGLPRFQNASRDSGFDPRYNPWVTVSRRGLTARVIGVLPADFIERHGGMSGVVSAYPWLVPVQQTAFHTVRPEDGSRAASQRESRGEIVESEVRDLPPGSVMVVYPVSVANRAAGWNTLAGNWRIDLKDASKPDNAKGRFGRFPFLLYTGANGHALHGPITTTELRDAWALRRGEVSHGCNRMEGEHVLELSVLVGCAGEVGPPRCPAVGPGPEDDERVTVMEEFDHVPDPARRVPAGQVASWGPIESGWIGIDVDYPRVDGHLERQRSQGLVFAGSGGDRFRLEKVRIPYREARSGQNAPSVRRVVFSTWDNRDRQLVQGRDCR